jgi:hypothetical protein
MTQRTNPDVTPALPMWDKPLHFNAGALTPEHLDGAARMKAERDREMIALGAESPLRGSPWIEQDDVDGLALFDIVRSPKLF